MSWADLPIVARLGDAVLGAVYASCNAADRNIRQRLRITVRPDLLDGGCAWWVTGAAVAVQVGRDTHAGGLRLSPAATGAGVILSKPVGRGRSPTLNLIGFPHLASGIARKGEALEYDHDDDWIELTLPSWATPLPRAAPPAVKASVPYFGISEREPDPAKALQAANGGRVR